MKVKNMYLVVITIIGLISLAMYSTFAMFTASIDTGEFVNLTSSLAYDTNLSEYERLTINAGETKIIDLNINNTTDNSLYYGVWYEMIEPTSINDNIVIAKLDTSENATIGDITSSGSKKVTLILINNSEEAMVINIGIAYSNTSSLNLPTNRNLITAEAAHEEIAVDKIINLSQGTTWSSGASGVYEVTYTKEDGTTIGKDYRYIGANVHNYVKFNNDMYQIIGVFDENTHGISGEYLVKLILADKLTATSYGVYNSSATSGTYSSYKNDWTGVQYATPANLNILLNEYFFNKTDTSTTYGSCSDWTYFYSGNNYKTKDCQTLVGYGIDTSIRDYIETVTWHLNGYSSNGLTSNNFYLCERGMYTVCASANSGAGDTATSAKIGLMYPSDYMYASGYKASSSTTTGSSSDNGSQNWMFKGYEWTITPRSDHAYFAFIVLNSGFLSNSSTGSGLGARPTFYLKSSIKITGGKGTFENPYTIG